MCNSEKIAYLRQYLDSSRKTRRILEEMEAQRDLMLSVRAVSYDDMPHRSGENTADLANIIERIEELYYELQAEVDREMEIRSRIASDINRMQDETLRSVLYYWYILGLKPVDIAERMHYDSIGWIYKLRDKALDSFEIGN